MKRLVGIAVVALLALAAAPATQPTTQPAAGNDVLPELTSPEQTPPIVILSKTGFGLKVGDEVIRPYDKPEKLAQALHVALPEATGEDKDKLVFVANDTCMLAIGLRDGVIDSITIGDGKRTGNWVGEEGVKFGDSPQSILDKLGKPMDDVVDESQLAYQRRGGILIFLSNGPQMEVMTLAK